MAHLSARRNVQQAQEESLAGCGKTILIRESFDGLHVWDEFGLSGYLVCLVHLVSPMQPNKPDRPNEQDRLADFFSILLGLFDRFFDERFIGLCIEGHHGLTFRKITRDGEFFGVRSPGGLDSHQ